MIADDLLSIIFISLTAMLLQFRLIVIHTCFVGILDVIQEYLKLTVKEFMKSVSKKVFPKSDNCLLDRERVDLVNIGHELEKVGLWAVSPI